MQRSRWVEGSASKGLNEQRAPNLAIRRGVEKGRKHLRGLINEHDIELAGLALQVAPQRAGQRAANHLQPSSCVN